MPFNFFLWRFLIPGKTSWSEPGTGWGIQVQRKDDETILFFRIERGPFRRYCQQRRWPAVENAADVLVFYRRFQQSPVLLFVELKGSDIEHGARQLGQTIEAVRGALDPALVRDGDFRALILSTGSAPREVKRFQKQFRDSHGIELAVQAGIRRGKRIDLRPYLG